jgi:hypothetical protein
MNAEITLQSGLHVTIVHLDQHLVYAGVVEGVPNSRINRELVAEAVREATTLCPDAQCHLIQPSESPYRGRPHIVLLPAVVCAALLKRVGTTPDDWPCRELLVVVWFQEEYAMPVAPSVMAQLQSLDWKRLAVQLEM